jgi:hypothetical protein
MPYTKDWLKMGSLLTFFSAALCCAVLGIQLLVRDDTTTAGIATFFVGAYPSFDLFCLANTLFSSILI